jgi:hypothetical protein
MDPSISFTCPRADRFFANPKSINLTRGSTRETVEHDRRTIHTYKYLYILIFYNLHLLFLSRTGPLASVDTIKLSHEM